MSRGHVWSVSVWSVTIVLLSTFQTTSSQDTDRTYHMDRLATCGGDVSVFDNDIIVQGRSAAAPPNPPLECILYLTSGYSEANGRNRLQIVIEAIDIQDCDVHVDVFNGKGAFGSYLRSLGCNSMSTDTLYTTSSQATIRLTRPLILYQTAYTFLFKIRTWQDRDSGGIDTTTNRLSPGAIIGIIVGIVALFVVAILLLWCYKTGRIGGYYGGGYAEDNYPVSKTGSTGEINDGVNLEKSESLGSAIDYRDPGVWSSVTNGQYTPGQPQKLGRNFYQQKRASDRYGYGQNGRQVGLATEDGYRSDMYGHRNGRQLDSAYDDSYEPYERDANVKLNMGRSDNAEWKKGEGGEFDRNDNKRATTGSRGEGVNGEADTGGEGTFKRDYGTRGSRGSRGSKGGESKRASFADRKGDQDTDQMQRGGENGELDQSGYDSFARDAPGGSKLRSSDRDSTRGSKRGKQTHPPGGTDDSVIELPESTTTVPTSAPPTDPQSNLAKDGHFFPENEPSDIGGMNPDSPRMKRYSSMDLQSEPESDVMSNPAHVNAAVRASIPGEKGSPSPKKRKKKRGKGGDDSGTGLLPEASEPIFSTPVSETPYDPSASLPYTSYGVPSYDAMYPYGMMPMSGMVPMPGQTYAYYQMGPMPGAPPTGMPTDQQPVMAGQAAWYVQDTPQGPVQKGFMVTSEAPKNKHRGGATDDTFGPPGTPGYTSTPATALTPKRGRKHRSSQPPDPVDMSVLAAGGPPPEPGAGQRSAVMRKGLDPNTGMHVNQVVWRDTIVDPTDPGPEDNPQITRKTLTRITTRSGHGDLPTDQNPMAYDDYSDRLGIESESPAFLSPSRPTPALPPAASTPDTDNIAFYLGQGRHPGAPEPIIHDANTRNRAFRDRITIGDSTA